MKELYYKVAALLMHIKSVLYAQNVKESMIYIAVKI